MPISVTTTGAAGDVVALPFVGPVNHTVAILVDVSTLSDDEVDENGYIKPGVPLQANGDLVSGTGQVVMGLVVESVKIAADNVSGTLAAADDVEVTIATICQVNRDVVEDVLGRALSADELSAIGANDAIVLLPT